jgi:hypothetical protein
MYDSSGPRPWDCQLTFLDRKPKALVAEEARLLRQKFLLLGADDVAPRRVRLRIERHA